MITPEMIIPFNEALANKRALLRVKKEELARKESTLTALQNEQLILEEVNTFFASVIKEKITETKYKLESLVNQGLEFVFTDNKIFITIDSEFKNNKTIFTLSINKEGVNKGRAEDYGGGVLAVVAFLLKIAAIIITGTKRLMIDDEGLTFLSERYQRPVSVFIKKICEQLDFNIVMITHQQQLAKEADNIYRAKGNPAKGITFERITNDEVV